MGTDDKDRIKALMRAAAEAGDTGDIPGDIDPEEFNLGVDGHRITTRVDVGEFTDLKRKAMAAHGSQISDSSFFLSMSEERFAVAFGEEAYILVGGDPAQPETDLFDGL